MTNYLYKKHEYDKKKRIVQDNAKPENEVKKMILNDSELDGETKAKKPPFSLNLQSRYQACV